MVSSGRESQSPEAVAHLAPVERLGAALPARVSPPGIRRRPPSGSECGGGSPARAPDRRPPRPARGVSCAIRRALVRRHHPRGGRSPPAGFGAFRPPLPVRKLTRKALGFPKAGSAPRNPVSLSSQAIQGLSAGFRVSTVRLVSVQLDAGRCAFDSSDSCSALGLGRTHRAINPAINTGRLSSCRRGACFGEFAFGRARKYMGFGVTDAT